MKKYHIVALLLVISFLSAACGKNTQTDVKPLEGKYHYENRDLGFQVDLPAEFEYFQTQRVKGEGYIDLQILVPTSDTTISQEVRGYGTPLVIRVYDQEAWQKYDTSTEKKDFKKFGEKDRVYAIKFWNQVPKDWAGRWDNEYEKSLISIIKLF